MKLIASIILALFIGHFATAQTSTQVVNDTTIFENPDTPIRFKGGDDILIKDIQKHLKYPEKSKGDGIEGKVMVSFVVEKNGKLSNITIVKGLNDELNAEVIRVVTKLDGWIPAQNQGVTVRARMYLPFQLNLR